MFGDPLGQLEVSSYAQLPRKQRVVGSKLATGDQLPGFGPHDNVYVRFLGTPTADCGFRGSPFDVPVSNFLPSIASHDTNVNSHQRSIITQGACEAVEAGRSLTVLRAGERTQTCKCHVRHDRCYGELASVPGHDLRPLIEVGRRPIN